MALATARMTGATLTCVTCKQPILLTDEWSWLDGRKREPEHDRCYNERFAQQFPRAPKIKFGGADAMIPGEPQNEREPKGAHEHFCSGCFPQKTNGSSRGWWRCFDDPCTKLDAVLCKIHRKEEWR